MYLHKKHLGSHSSYKKLTTNSSRGRSPPLLIPLFMVMKFSTVGFSLTLGLCRLVLSMMIANEST